MSLTPLTDEAALDSLVADGALTVAYFSTPTCNVCTVLRPKVEALLRDRGIPGAYIDTTLLPETAGQRMVFSVPTVLVLADGREAQRYGRHFSVHALAAYLDRMQAMMA